LDEQLLSEPQLATHWVPHSWQMKYGSVWEYSVRLGDWPLEQTHAYVRELASHSLLSVSADAAAVWRQMSGHCDSSFVHQFCLVVLLTEFGSMEYVSWAETVERRRVAEAANAVAVKLFMLGMCVVFVMLLVKLVVDFEELKSRESRNDRSDDRQLVYVIFVDERVCVRAN